VKIKPTTREAYQLFHEGALALAQIEHDGMRIDVGRLDETIEKAKRRVKRLIDELKQEDIWKEWKKRFADKASLGSRYQLAKLLAKELRGVSVGKTNTGRVKTNEESLDKLNLPFVKKYLKLEKTKKLLNTYLIGIRRETVDGFLHPSFNLHFAKTFRSSSSQINFQNLPIRDEIAGKLVRSCFIPRDGHVLVETDHSALEFRICGAFWRDKKMLAYISDKSLDIHKDMAAECFLLDWEEVSKEARFYAKNQFVFPQLYGSYYINCARNLWDAIKTHNLKNTCGQPIEDILREQGITKRGRCDSKLDPEEGTFEKHIMEVENEFHDRFPQWTERKEQWWKRYQERGWFRMMTGFRCDGIFSRNDLFNYPIQGPAFHLLLWSLIQMVNWLNKNKMRTKVIGQIHDSMLFDIYAKELDAVLSKAKEVMTEGVRRAWDWVIVPLEIEVEVARTNWYEKEGIEV
jgi:DNA polymerase-1